MQEDVNKENNVGNTRNNKVPSRAVLTAAINTIIKYISAAAGNDDILITCELGKYIEIFHQLNTKQNTILGILVQKLVLVWV